MANGRLLAMLPTGFNWTHVLQWDTGPVDCLRLGGSEVARLSRRVNDQVWLAYLNQHWPYEDRRNHKRVCHSYETGKAGIELWAARHEARLRQEVQKMRAKKW